MSETHLDRTLEAAQAALDHAQYIAGEIGPRPVGSDAEQEAARYVQGRLSAFGLPNATLHEFSAPGSEWLPFALAGATALLGVAFYLVLGGSLVGAYLGALGLGFGLWEVYAKLAFGWSPLSGLIPNTQTQNVVASIQPTEMIGRNAVIFAHLDSQRTPWFFRSHTSLRLFFGAAYVVLAVLVLTLLAFVFSWFSEFTLPAWAGLPALVLATATVVVMVQAHFTPYSVGANDNASAVGVALELARHFAANPLKNTRLWFVFTSAEETGCHGAAAFLGSQGEQLIQAYAVALEGVGVHTPAYTYREGTLTTYRSNGDLLRILDRLQKARPDLGLRRVSIRGGYTEAGVAIKRGYRSVALVGLDERGDLPYWHTMEDTPDKLRPEALAAAFEVTRALLEDLDDLPVSARLSAVKPLRERD
ncbi:MAG: M28 family metallopeptidase [Anaerolineae bacterium]|jgi:hypothetical protein